MKLPQPAITIPAIIMLTALCAFLLFRAHHPASSASGSSTNPIPTQVYVWQRTWTPAVASAVRTRGPAFNRIVVLARQITWENGQARTYRVAVDWHALASTHSEIAAAVRIERPPAPRPATTTTATSTTPSDAAYSAAVAQAFTDIRAEAAQNHITLAELQLNYNVSVARIPAYRQWLAAAKPAAGTLPLAITTVPACLDSPDFPTLAKTAGSYILQVHGIERPQTIADPLIICDPNAARKAIAKAGHIAVPFRVALPTYSYAVAFDAAGQFAGMVAEGAPPDWATGEGKTIRRAESHPRELAALVSDLIASHPPAMQGIVWYRLPVDTDKLNWKWETLSSVMQGRYP